MGKKMIKNIDNHKGYGETLELMRAISNHTGCTPEVALDFLISQLEVHSKYDDHGQLLRYAYNNGWNDAAREIQNLYEPGKHIVVSKQRR